MRESQMTVRGRPGHWTYSCSGPVTEGHGSWALQLLQLPGTCLLQLQQTLCGKAA